MTRELVASGILGPRFGTITYSKLFLLGQRPFNTPTDVVPIIRRGNDLQSWASEVRSDIVKNGYTLSWNYYA